MTADLHYPLRRQRQMCIRDRFSLGVQKFVSRRNHLSHSNCERQLLLRANKRYNLSLLE